MPAGDADDDSGDDLGDVVPAAFAVARPRRAEETPGASGPPPAHTFAQLLRRPVVVDAQGFTYRGVLQGADEHELYLRGELRFLVLPLDTVRSVRLDAERAAADDDRDDDDRGDDAHDHGPGSPRRSPGR
jgi:hypothetical protein